VFGKFTTREYERTNGQIRSELKIEAEAVGPNLQRTIAAVSRRSSNAAPQTPSTGPVAPHLAPVPDTEEDAGLDRMAEEEAVLADALPGGSE
jgi:single-strand DNA-binding protein